MDLTYGPEQEAFRERPLQDFKKRFATEVQWTSNVMRASVGGPRQHLVPEPEGLEPAVDHERAVRRSVVTGAVDDGDVRGHADGG